VLDALLAESSILIDTGHPFKERQSSRQRADVQGGRQTSLTNVITL
jgi:hypothetical protein